MTDYEKLRADGFDPSTYDKERHINEGKQDVFTHPKDPGFVRLRPEDCWRPYDPDKHNVPN